MIKKLGRIYSYRDAHEARHLLRKNVLVSNSLYHIAEKPTICWEMELRDIEYDNTFPFWAMDGRHRCACFQFIREIIQTDIPEGVDDEHLVYVREKKDPIECMKCRFWRFEDAFCEKRCVFVQPFATCPEGEKKGGEI